MGVQTRHTDRSLFELLEAYSQALTLVESSSSVLWVACSRGKFVRRLKLPRPRWALRLLVLKHATGVVDTLKRQSYAESIFGPHCERGTEHVELMERWESSLPSIATTRRLATFIGLGAFVTAYVLANFVFPASQSPARFLGHITRNFVALDRASVVETVADAHLSLPDVGGVVNLILWSLWLAFLPLILAFGFKRVLFAMESRTASGLRSYLLREGTPIGTGIYQLEVNAFRSVGTTRPSEFPVDLVAGGLLVSSLLSFAITALASAVEVVGVRGLIHATAAFLTLEGALFAIAIAAYWLILETGRGRDVAATATSQDLAAPVSPLALRASYWLAVLGVVLVVGASIAPQIADRVLAPAGLQIAQSR